MTTDAPTEIPDWIAHKRARAANLAHAALSLPTKQWNAATVLVLSFVAFVVASSPDTSLTDLGVLVTVLLVHEAGHLLGMRLFGFSDLKMFFLPFLGAAASGRKPAASAVEHAIVSLLGPLPGLVLALALSFVADIGKFPDGPLPPLANFVLMLVLINGFNLLPILPLDGGRFFQTLLFARTPALDVLFRLLAIFGLGWMALHGSPFLGVLAVLLVAQGRFQMKVAFAASRLRRAYQFSPDVSANGDEELAALYNAAEGAAAGLGIGSSGNKKFVQQAVREMFDRVAHVPAKWWQILLLILAWLLAIVVGFAALVVIFWQTRPH